MKAFLNTIETDKKGSEPKHALNLGCITAKIEGLSNGSISVDVFNGQGDTYKRREDANICIYYGGILEFEGSLTELINRIKN